MLIDALQAAFDGLDDFISVQTAEDGDIRLDAVEALQRSVGIDDDERVAFARRLAEMQPGAHAGAVLLGVIVGLTAARHDAELGD